MHQIDEKVLANFNAATTAEEFVTGEFSRYFATPSGESTAEATSRAMDRAVAGIDALDDAMLDARQLAAVTMLFNPPGSNPGELYATATMPSPESLMLAAANRVAPGTSVVVTQIFLDGCRAQRSAVWPFAMDQAVTLTTPSAHDELHATALGPDGADSEDDLAQVEILISTERAGWVYRSLNWGVAKLGGDRDPLHAAGVGVALAGALVALHRLRHSTRP